LNWDKYDENKNFKTWLFTIARNTTTDWLRKKKPILFSSLDPIEAGEEFSDQLIDQEPLPEELFLRKELDKILEDSLSKINIDQRTVILLHLEQDLTFEEISQIVNKPTNTVKSQYHRGLLALRALLAPK
jgi:RNA polymerase sigma-70 factor (ECF subfamily)